MKNVFATLTVVLLTLFLPWLAHSQEAEAPIYKEGDWWKVKFELESGSPRDSCSYWYSEYVVKIEKGKPKVYGVSGTTEEEIECPGVEAHVLGKGPSARDRLKFPLGIGNSWKSRFFRSRGRRDKGRWHYREYKVRGWEKVKTPKGEFEAFKLTRFFSTSSRGRTREFAATYYYSPKVKAIISKKSRSPARQRTLTLVDFNVSN